MNVRSDCIAVAILAGVVLLPASGRAAAELPPLPSATELGWRAYVAASEDRMARDAMRDLPAVHAGETPVTRVDPPNGPGSRALGVRDAWVHHWRGAILLPGATLDHVMARLERNVPTAPDVISSTILRRAGPELTVFLRVRRQQSLAGMLTFTFVYDTVHAVTLARLTGTRGSSTIRATRIFEVEGAGSSHERILPHSEDNGFLWRWHSYWRYQQTAAGVIAQCESVSLSRTAPFGTRLVAERLASGTAVDAMTRALVSLRDWVAPDRMPHASLPVRSAWR